MGGLQKVMRATMEDASKFHKPFINMAAMSTVIDSTNQALSSLQGVFQGLSNAYRVQIEAEQKLETVMRQRMDATDEEIQSIKDLTAAQQQLGIIGDEVQLAGAQQLATFLKNTSTLQQLIPAMNDLVAQQKGYSATGNDAVAVANLMGKALQGQASALRRVGITFDETQEAMLKNGTESQRAATLAEVITQNVGHMNAALAQTPTGKLKQVENAIGDLKESLGGLATKILPYLTFVNQLTIASTNLFKLRNAAKIAIGSIKNLGVTTRLTTAVMNTLGVSARTASIAVKGLLISTGVGAAIAAATFFIEKFCSSTDNAAEEMNDAAQEAEQWRRSLVDLSGVIDTSVASEVASLDRLYQAATNERLSREERYAAAVELQSLYPQTFSNLEREAILAGNAASAYDELKESILSKARAKAAEKRIEQIGEESLGLNIEKSTLLEESKEAKKKIAELREEVAGMYKDAQAATFRPVPDTTAFDRRIVADLATMQLEALEAKEAERQKRLEEIAQKEGDINAAIATLSRYVTEGGENAAEISAMNANQVKEAISRVNSELDKTLDPQKIKELNAQLKALEARKTVIDALLGRNTGGTAKTVSVEFYTSVGVGAFTQLGQYDQLLKELNEARPAATQQMLQEIDREIDKVTALKDLFVRNIHTRDKIENIGPELLGKMPTVTLPAVILPEKIDVSHIDEAFKKLREEAEQTARSLKDSMLDGWSGIKGIAGGVNSLTDAITGQGTAWERLSGFIDGAIAVYEGVQKAMEFASVMSTIFQATKKSETVTTQENTNANVMNAASQVMQAHSWMPFVGIALAAASVAAMIATMASVPKFAKGGVAYGPTLGLFGEYPGAANNPEVVAPLNTLRSLLVPLTSGPSEVLVRIKGRDLVGVSESRKNLTNRI